MWNVFKNFLAKSSQLCVLLILISGCSGFLNQYAVDQATQTHSLTITGLSLGAIPGGTVSAPPLTISSVTSSTNSSYTLQARIVDLNDTALSSWASFASTNAIAALTLNNYTRYKYEARGLFATGLGSTPVASGYWIPESDACKEGRITDSPYANSSDSPTGANLANAIEICTAEQLQEIAGDTANYGDYFKLDASLNMADLSSAYVPIGTSVAPFYGTLDGQTRNIHNLTINSPTTDNVGLIGYVTGVLTVLDINLLNVSIVGKDYVGGLVGNIVSAGVATISNVSTSGGVSGVGWVGGIAGQLDSAATSNCTNCTSSASVAGTGFYSGGLGGYVARFDIFDSYATGNVNGNATVGGLLGGSAYSTIENSYATGTVVGTNSYCGGLVGYQGTATGEYINNVYATGNVTCAGNSSGGLIGHANSVSAIAITNAYASGNVSGLDYVGGLIGWVMTVGGTYQNLYATGNVAGNNRVAGLMGYFRTWGAAFNLENSFATGVVIGDSATNLVSPLVGEYVGTGQVNSHYASNVSCTNISGVCTLTGTGRDLGITPNYFFVSTNAPLSSWNFATIWQAFAAAFPTLR